MQHSKPTSKPRSAVDASSIKSWLMPPFQGVSGNSDSTTVSIALQPYLQHLPTEILIRIFDYLYDKTLFGLRDFSYDIEQVEEMNNEVLGFRKVYDDGCQSPSTVTSLMLTCRRFKEMLEPALYHRISIINGSSTGIRSTQNLLRTLTKRSDLSQSVHHLQLALSDTRPVEHPEVGNFDHNAPKDIQDILAILHKINPTELVIRGEFGPFVDSFVCCALTEFRIRTLRASWAWCQFAFQYLQSANGTSLKYLHLNACSKAYDSLDEPLRRIPRKQISSTNETSFDLEAVEFTCCDDALKELKDFCQFIPTLKVLNLSRMLRAFNRGCMRKRTQPFIDTHECTLTELHLPVAACKCKIIPSIARCTSLKELSLFWNDLSSTDPIIAIDRIERAPRLEHITIYMDTDMLDIAGSFFEKTESRWLTTFASNRKANSRLRYIHVILGDELISTSDLEEYEDNIEDAIRPWPHHYLYQLRPVLEDLGLTLSWSEPHFTQVEWEERMSKARRLYEETMIRVRWEEEGHEPLQVEHELDLDLRSRLPSSPPGQNSTQQRITSYLIPKPHHQ